MTGDTREKRYTGATPEAVGAAYTADAAEAARYGWTEVDKRWEGRTLIVTYSAPESEPVARATWPQAWSPSWNMIVVSVVVILVVVVALALRPGQQAVTRTPSPTSVTRTPSPTSAQRNDAPQAAGSGPSSRPASRLASTAPLTATGCRSSSTTPPMAMTGPPPPRTSTGCTPRWRPHGVHRRPDEPSRVLRLTVDPNSDGLDAAGRDSAPRRRLPGVSVPPSGTTRRPWELYAYDPTSLAVNGKREREWTAIGPTEAAVVAEMARCLMELDEGRWPK